MKKISGKKDRTRAKIIDTFIELINEKPLNQISIKEVTERCGVNRNTFYYHFVNIADLLESVVFKIVDEILTTHTREINSLESCLLAAVDFARTNKRAIDNIYHSTSRAIFERHLWHVCEYSVEAYLNSLPKEMLPPVDRRILQDLLKFECFGFAIDWLNHGMPDGVEEKIRILSDFWARA